MIYLDANVVIRLIEGDDVTRRPLTDRIFARTSDAPFLATSRLSLLETRSKPMKNDDRSTLAAYDRFFAGRELHLVEISEIVIDLATEFRAKYHLKSPDAIHFASAIVAGAESFLTADRGFQRCLDLPVEIL
jgi:predicted nucleic acid-binding protein